MPNREAVVVSGGSGGIGSAMCRELAQAGFVVFVGYAKHEASAQVLASEIGGYAVAIDLVADDCIESAVETILATRIPVAGIILAASPPPMIAPLFEIPADDFKLQWQVNVEGPRRLLDGMVRRGMKSRRTGWVIGILSQAMNIDGGGAAKNMGSYLIAKHGLQGLLKSLQSEYSWLSVTSVMPDYTETAMLKAFDERFLDILRARRPNQSFDKPETVAREMMNWIGNRA